MSIGGPFILVVEDDEQLRKIIARNLNALGYLVFQAASFEDAERQMAVKPQLMILDINLPDGSGWDVAGWLERFTDPVPIIVISGLRPDLKQFKHFQPVEFLPKPFDMAELLDLVQQHAPLSRVGGK